MNRAAATALALALGLALVAAPATAQRDWRMLSTKDAGNGMVRSSSGAIPAEGYGGQYWTHPKGCEYSRSGRPGEIVWYLIIQTRVKGCPTYIVQQGGADAYRRP